MARDDFKYLMLVSSSTVGVEKAFKHLKSQGIPKKDIAVLVWDEDVKRFKELCLRYRLPTMGASGPYLYEKKEGSLILLARGGKALCLLKMKKPR